MYELATRARYEWFKSLPLREQEAAKARESQRLDQHYYAVSRAGYDCTTGERDAGAVQRYAARRSKQTREILFRLIGGQDGKTVCPNLQGA